MHNKKSSAPIGKHQFSLVLPVSMFAKLQRLAVAGNTSISKLIINILTEAIGNEK